MKAANAFFITFLSLVISNACAQEYAVIHKGIRNHVNGKQIGYLPSGDTITSLQQAITSDQKGNFINNEKPDLNLGIAKDNYWVRFRLLNSSGSKKLNVVLENPRLNDVEVFVLQRDSLTLHAILGDNYSFEKRPVNFNQFAFPVNFAASDSAEIYLFIKHKGNTLQMPIRIMDENTFIGWVEGGYLITGLTTGIFAITFFFGVFFLFNTRDRLFVFYSGYILTAGIWLWATEGFGFQYLWPDHPELATRLGPGLSAVSACFFMACCLQFCKPYDQKSVFRKGLFVLLGLLILWTLQPFNPFVPITESTMSVFLTIYFSMNILIAVVMAIYLIQLSQKGYLIVLYYFSAVAVTMICSLLIVLRGGGVINLPVSSGIVMSGGYVVEIILMTAGITKQFYRYKQEREETLLAYLEQQKSITQKIVETIELERKRIGRELHDDIGSGLTQIALMSEAARQYSSGEERKTKELNDISATTRRLVTSIGEIIWALNPGNRTLPQLLVYMRDQLHKLLEYSGIQYEIKFPENVEAVELDNTLLRNILLITKELVNNAIKYSQASYISVQGVYSDGIIHFEVSDNGMGMDIEKVKVKNGLKNIRLRAEEMNGTLNLISSPGAGTVCRFEVICKIPL